RTRPAIRGCTDCGERRIRATAVNDCKLTVRMADSVGSLDPAQWDALTGGGNPFVGHTFLSIMEESGSVGGHSGWTPSPLVIEDGEGRLAGALPAYLKDHSQGEFVFDYAWADAW